MDYASPRFALPYLLPGQAQKDHFHNEALLRIDALVGAAVEDVAVTPPSAPVPGQCWIVGPGAGGPWAGRAGSIALANASGWRFIAPAAGMRLWNRAAEGEWRWTGASWTSGELFGSALFVGGQKVVSERQPDVPTPSGGTIIDAEARASLTQIIVALKSHGLID